MDVQLTEAKDENGNYCWDLDVTTVSYDGGIPIRDNTWFLNDMSEPTRFIRFDLDDSLVIEDENAYIFGNTLYMTTDTATAGLWIKDLFQQPEIQQRALVAAGLQRGTIPSMPDTGNYTAEFLTEGVTASVYNRKVLENIQELAGTLSYKPHYAVQNGALIMTIRES